MANRYLDTKGNDSWTGDQSAPVKDTLSAQLASGVTTELVVVTGVEGFASSGAVVIFSDAGTEWITYSGKDEPTKKLTGLTRNQYNSDGDLTHDAGSYVYQTQSAGSWLVYGPQASVTSIDVNNQWYAAPGRYVGGIAYAALTRAYYVKGSGQGVIFDGDNEADYLFSGYDALTVELEDIEMRNYLTAPIFQNRAGSSYTLSGYTRRCRFVGNYTAVSVSGRDLLRTHKCLFVGNAICFLTNTTVSRHVISNTFYNNDVVFSSGSSTTSGRSWNNAFAGNGTVYKGLQANWGISSNWNGYYGNTHIAEDTGGPTFYDTLAAFKAVYGGEDQSLDETVDPLMNAPDKTMFGLRVTSPYRAAGNGHMPIGAFGVAIGISDSHPDHGGLWGSNGVLVNTNIDGDSVILGSGSSEGTWAPNVLDLGKPRGIRDIRAFGIEDRPESVFDKDNTDEFPNLLTMEARADRTTFLKDAAEAGDLVFTEFERGATPVLPNSEGNSQQFVQPRVTIRSDGA